MNEPNGTQDVNMEVARRIGNELLGEPDSSYRGKWIEFANGQVVVVADTFDEAAARLRQIEPDPSRGLLMEGLGENDEGELETYGELLCPLRGNGCPLTPRVVPGAPRSEEGVPMSPVSDVFAINSELAQKINEEARRDPKSPYAGKFVGIANGRVAVVTDSLDDAVDRLLEIEPDPSKCFCIEAGVDDSEIQEIGEVS